MLYRKLAPLVGAIAAALLLSACGDPGGCGISAGAEAYGGASVGGDSATPLAGGAATAKSESNIGGATSPSSACD